MQLAFIDFETYWDAEHSLSKMPPAEYVMSPETELISCSIKVGSVPTVVAFGEDAIRESLSSIDWPSTFLIGHNMSFFDAMILAWRLGIRPAMWGCTLAMARPIHAKDVGLSLAKLVAHYGLGVKNNAILLNTKGKHLADFTPDEIAAMRIYNRDDTDQCAALFHVLKQHYTAAELFHIDCNIRMLTEPAFELDVALLETALSVERSDKLKHLVALAGMLRPPPGEQSDAEVPWGDEPALTEWVRGQLASAPKFSALLNSRGVPTPMKPSPTNPANQVPALAKTDEDFVALQEHEDPVVATAARARLAIKSTLLETRIQAILSTGEMLRGRLPVPLNYAGADTTGRDSGCLVTETEVTVYDRLTRTVAPKRIVDVLESDLVWDGESFVPHDGVVFSGFAEVITWDGVTGTADHVVFTEVGEISLSDARARGAPIQTAARPSQYHLDAAREYADSCQEQTARPVRAERNMVSENGAGERTLVAVYDIRNCGPRSRFAANGRLVHNSWYNLQNLPRIGPVPKTSDALRRSLRAPRGHLIGVADQSSIELRVNHFLWRVPSSMAMFRESPGKADLYKSFAAENLYHVPPEQITKAQRQVGKVAQLGLGFGSGAATFQRVARVMGGVDLPLSHPTELSAESVTSAWRAAYPEIVDGWKTCQSALPDIIQGVSRTVDPWGLVTTRAEGMRLPSGRLIRYPGLRLVDDGQYWPDGRSKRSWVYAEGRHKTYLTGPKVTENLVQALARDSVFDAALEFFKQTRFRPVMRLHDELIYVFPESEAAALLAELQRVMRTPPSWWPELVVWSEGDIGDNYGAAK
jgi:hypothetical protein